MGVQGKDTATLPDGRGEDQQDDGSCSQGWVQGGRGRGRERLLL